MPTSWHSILHSKDDDAANENLIFSFDTEILGNVIDLDAAPLVEWPIESRPKRDTKAIGDRSEFEVAIVLARAGYIVSRPYADSLGSIQVRCCSMHSHRGGAFSRSYRGEIDFIGVFCPQTGEVYLIPENEITATMIHLHVDPTATRQDWHIRWAHRYKVIVV